MLRSFVSKARGYASSRRVPVILIALAACTLQVAPNLEGTAHTVRSQRWGACVAAEGYRHELRPIEPAAGFVAVGHEKLFVRGADPFPCHHSFDHRYAALLRFDIPGDARPIVRALLRPVEAVRKGRRGVYNQTTEEECILTVARSAEILSEGFSSGRVPRTEPLFSSSGRNGSLRIGQLSPEETHAGIDVTSVAQEWQNGESPNLGFVITSERAFNRDQSSLCLHDVKFEVEVEFADE